jgi:hypothetical protein
VVDRRQEECEIGLVDAPDRDLLQEFFVGLLPGLDAVPAPVHEFVEHRIAWLDARVVEVRGLCQRVDVPLDRLVGARGDLGHLPVDRLDLPVAVE